MPNWVSNTVTISGDARQVQKVVYQLARPYTVPHESGVRTVSDPVFALWNIARPAEHLRSVYFAAKDPLERPPGSRPSTRSELQWHIDNSDHWYFWNMRNWGTKWDVANDIRTTTTCERPADNAALYRFSSAWAPPVAALATLSTQHPDLHIELRYMEDEGWGGEIEFSAGESVAVTEWDAPSSHTEALLRQGECMCELNDEAWFDDCPLVASPNAG